MQPFIDSSARSCTDIEYVTSSVPNLNRRKRKRLRPAVKHNKRRKKLFESWKQLLLIDPAQSMIGNQIAAAKDNKEVTDMLAYTFAGRSNSTLAMCIGPLLQYLVWRPMLDCTWTPEEENLYLFMKHYCGRDKPLTRARTTVEAFKYFLHVCRGTLKLAHTMESLLINGMPVEHMTGMGTRKQSAELSVESMLVLEELVHHGAIEEVRRMIVGGGILCAYLRSRFFDSDQITPVTLEKRVMAIQVELTKTCRNDKDRLPKFMLAPRNTISGLDVLASHLSWREKIGVPLGPYPMFPAYGAEGWLKDAAELADERYRPRSPLVVTPSPS